MFFLMYTTKVCHTVYLLYLINLKIYAIYHLRIHAHLIIEIITCIFGYFHIKVCKFRDIQTHSNI